MVTSSMRCSMRSLLCSSSSSQSDRVVASRWGGRAWEGDLVPGQGGGGEGISHAGWWVPGVGGGSVGGGPSTRAGEGVCVGVVMQGRV